MEVQCYTDGSLIGNGKYKGAKAGAWAYKIIMNEEQSYIEHGRKMARNNTLLEMEAIKQLLFKLNEFRNSLKDVQVVVYSDCKTTVEAINKSINKDNIKFKFKNVFNDIMNLVNTIGLNISFKWIKGHSGIIHNDEVDNVARENARSLFKELKATCFKVISDCNYDKDNIKILTKKPEDTDMYIKHNKILLSYKYKISDPKESKVKNKFNRYKENNGIEKAIEVRKRGEKYVLIGGYISYLWLLESGEILIPVKIIE